MIVMAMGEEQSRHRAQVHVIDDNLVENIGREVDFKYIINQGGAACTDVFAAQLTRLCAGIATAEQARPTLSPRRTEQSYFHYWSYILAWFRRVIAPITGFPSPWGYYSHCAQRVKVNCAIPALLNMSQNDGRCPIGAGYR